MLARQRAESLAGTDFEQHVARIIQQLANTVGEANGLAEMAGPVIDRLRLVGRDPFRSDVRNERNLRIRESYLAQKLGKGRESRFHHRRMKGVRCRQAACGDFSGFEFLFERFNRAIRTSNDTKAGRVDSGDGEIGIQQRSHILFRRADHEHRAARK